LTSLQELSVQRGVKPEDPSPDDGPKVEAACGDEWLTVGGDGQRPGLSLIMGKVSPVEIVGSISFDGTLSDACPGPKRSRTQEKRGGPAKGIRPSFRLKAETT
jgi:hypothetical protein